VNEITTTVQIADSTGATTLQLTQQETLDRVAGMEGIWVFAGDLIVQPAELAEANWDTVGTVRLVPALVGGCKHGRNPSVCKEWLGRAKEIHGDRYDYTESEYRGANEKIAIRCREHGTFEQRATGHLLGEGCAKCDTTLTENEGLEQSILGLEQSILSLKSVSVVYRVLISNLLNHRR